MLPTSPPKNYKISSAFSYNFILALTDFYYLNLLITITADNVDDLGQIAFRTSDLQKFFPKSYTPRQMSDTILRLLEQWQRRRQRDQQR